MAGAGLVGARSSDLSLEKVGNCGFYKKFLNIKCREVRIRERTETGAATMKSAVVGAGG